EAIAHYVKAVQLAPTHQEAVYEIGRVHLKQGDQEGVQQITYKLDPYLRDLLLKEMEVVESADKGGAADDPNLPVLRTDSESRPTILYREKAKYTSMAHEHNTEGVVVFSVVFAANEKLTSSHRQTLRVMAGDSYAERRRSFLVGVTFRASDPVVFNLFSRY